MDDNNYTTAQAICELTEQVEGYKETNGNLIEANARLHKENDGLRGQRRNAEDMYLVKYDECETLDAQNKELRRRANSFDTVIQRWVDRYELLSRKLDDSIGLAKAREVTIRLISNEKDRQAAKIRELAELGAKRLSRIMELAKEIDELGVEKRGLAANVERLERLDKTRVGHINELDRKMMELAKVNVTRLKMIDALNGQLDTDWVNDMTVQELETQGLKIGEQVQVLMQQLNNIRTMR